MPLSQADAELMEAARRHGLFGPQAAQLAQAGASNMVRRQDAARALAQANEPALRAAQARAAADADLAARVQAVQDTIRGDIRTVRNMPRAQMLAAQGMQEGPPLPAPVRILSAPEAAAIAAAEIQAQTMRFNPQDRTGHAVQNLPQALVRVADPNGNPMTRWNPDVLAAAGVTQTQNDRNLTTVLQGQKEARRRIGITDDMTPQQVAAANANLQQQAAQRATAAEAAKAERVAKVNQMLRNRNLMRQTANERAAGGIPAGISDAQYLSMMSGGQMGQGFADPSMMWKLAELSLQQQQVAAQNRLADATLARQTKLDNDQLLTNELARKKASVEIGMLSTPAAQNQLAAQDIAAKGALESAKWHEGIEDPEEQLRRIASSLRSGAYGTFSDLGKHAYQRDYGFLPAAAAFSSYDLSKLPPEIKKYLDKVYDNEAVYDRSWQGDAADFYNYVRPTLSGIGGLTDDDIEALVTSYYESR